jgi:hypothetical protein
MRYIPRNAQPCKRLQRSCFPLPTILLGSFPLVIFKAPSTHSSSFIQLQHLFRFTLSSYKLELVVLIWGEVTTTAPVVPIPSSIFKLYTSPFLTMQPHMRPAALPVDTNTTLCTYMGATLLNHSCRVVLHSTVRV